MLIEFRVENHRSLRDEQVLTLEAAAIGDPSDSRPREAGGHGQRLLPAAVLYGANASGKSNVLSAICFMRDAVLYSHRAWDPDSGVPRSQFAWGEKQKEPSTFEASFLHDETKYEYGFSVSDTAVEEEWLYAWPNNRKQVWLERDEGNFKFGEHLKGPNEVMKDVTRSNALFLSVASQHKHPQLSSIYSWFRNISPVNIQGRGTGSLPSWAVLSRMFTSDSARVVHQPVLFPDDSDEKMTEQIQQLLKAADTGIVDVKVVADDEPKTKAPFKRQRIQLKHQTNDEESWLDLSEESQGTKTLFSMAPPIFKVLSAGGLLLVDELESSLHPLLGLAIVRMFNSPDTNPKNGQILFTTHDTNLLGTTLGESPLRRDQIWFTEKDKEGASKLYPLTDYKPRKSENLERGYLQGRYGAIPFLGDIACVLPAHTSRVEK